MNIFIQYLHLLIVTFSILIFTFFQWIISWLPFPRFFVRIADHFTIFRRIFRTGVPKRISTDLRHDVPTTMELIKGSGYECEQHSILTKDGYILGMHRLCHETPTTYQIATDILSTLSNEKLFVSQHPLVQRLDLHVPTGTGTTVQKHYSLPTLPKRVHEFLSSSSSSSAILPLPSSSHRPPVLLMHGLMMCSEIWVANGNDALPYLLYRHGYDVWMGNFRGNRYSSKHVRYSTESSEFWNFSLDEIMRYDIPTLIQYILRYTQYNRLAYIGFSQGSAVMFGALSLYPSLQHSLSVCVSLSPAMALRGLSHSPVTTIVSTDTSFLYLIFGKKRMLRIALDLQRILSPTVWVTMVDFAMAYLFGWRSHNIDPVMKLSLYHHIFSLTSVKTIVHWFHIIASQRFEMFAEYLNPSHGSIYGKGSVGSSTANATVDIASSLRWFTSFRSLHDQQIMPLYDTRMVQTPLAFFVGGADTLIDIEKLLMILPAYSGSIKVPRNQSRMILYQPLPGTKAQHLKVTYQQLKQLRSFALATLAVQRSNQAKVHRNSHRLPSLVLSKDAGYIHRHSSTIASHIDTRAFATTTASATESSGGNTTVHPILSMEALRHQESAKLDRLRLPFTLPKHDMYRRIHYLNLETRNVADRNYHRYASQTTTVEPSSTLPSSSIITDSATDASNTKPSSFRSSKLHLPIARDTKPTTKKAGIASAASSSSSSSLSSLHRSMTLPESALEAIAKLVRDEEETVSASPLTVQPGGLLPYPSSTLGTSGSSSSSGNASSTPLSHRPRTNTHTNAIKSPLSVSSPRSSSFRVRSLPLTIPSGESIRTPTLTTSSSASLDDASTASAFVYEQHAPFIFQEPTYEHLDYLWATTVKDRAFPSVLLVLDKYRHRQIHDKASPATDRATDSP